MDRTNGDNAGLHFFALRVRGLDLDFGSMPFVGAVLTVLTFSALFGGCTEGPSEQQEFDPALVAELEEMIEIDQVAAYIPQGNYEEMSREQWNAFKDSVFTTNTARAEEIFNSYGFVGFDLAGEEGSNNFWAIIQHSDHDPEFQGRVLEAMKAEVDRGNADPSNYGYLLDRVRLNTGAQQVYGTQVDYDSETGQAYPRNLEDSSSVNVRRRAIGLEPIEEYLNSTTTGHFEMNKKYWLEEGITAPVLYETYGQQEGT